MNRRLVEIDSSTYYAKEVDVKRLQREASALKALLLSLKDDSLRLRDKIVPYCDKALNAELTLPLDPYDEPIHLNRLLDEGVELPEGFTQLYSQFFNTAMGARVDVENIVNREGRLFGWMEFE